MLITIGKPAAGGLGMIHIIIIAVVVVLVLLISICFCKMKKKMCFKGASVTAVNDVEMKKENKK